MSSLSISKLFLIPIEYEKSQCLVISYIQNYVTNM